MGVNERVRIKLYLMTVLVLVQVGSVFGSSCSKECSYLDSEVVGGMATWTLTDKIERAKPEIKPES